MTTDNPQAESHWHGSVYMLANEHGRTDVEVHPANWMGDSLKGYHCDLLGCIALGEAVGELAPVGARRRRGGDPGHMTVLTSNPGW